MRRPWGVYLQESLGIAAFMLFGGLMKVLLFHPDSPASRWIQDPFAKNAVVALLFFPVMLFGIVDALWYVVFQFVGGLVTMALMRLVLNSWFTHPAVDMNASKPGADRPWVALGVEFAITLGHGRPLP